MKAIILDDAIILILDNVSCLEKGDSWEESLQKTIYTIHVSEIGKDSDRVFEFDNIELRDRIWGDIKHLMGM
jgi:hypothetical protein